MLKTSENPKNWWVQQAWGSIKYTYPYGFCWLWHAYFCENRKHAKFHTVGLRMMILKRGVSGVDWIVRSWLKKKKLWNFQDIYYSKMARIINSCVADFGSKVRGFKSQPEHFPLKRKKWGGYLNLWTLNPKSCMLTPSSFFL